MNKFLQYSTIVFSAFVIYQIADSPYFDEKKESDKQLIVKSIDDFARNVPDDKKTENNHYNNNAVLTNNNYEHKLPFIDGELVS